MQDECCVVLGYQVLIAAGIKRVAESQEVEERQTAVTVEVHFAGLADGHKRLSTLNQTGIVGHHHGVDVSFLDRCSVDCEHRGLCTHERSSLIDSHTIAKPLEFQGGGPFGNALQFNDATAIYRNARGRLRNHRGSRTTVQLNADEVIRTERDNEIGVTDLRDAEAADLPALTSLPFGNQVRFTLLAAGGATIRVQ